jgi:Transposase
MQYLGIDWGTRKAAWCAVDERGELAEGMVPADEDGLAWSVHRLGPDVRGCVEMMSGAVWVRDQLRACGWQFEIADGRKVKAIAPLACKTDRVDARVLAQLARRDLVPEWWVPSLSDRELRERLRRRAHLVRLEDLGAQSHVRPADPMGNARQPQDAAPARVAGAARRTRSAGGVAPVVACADRVSEHFVHPPGELLDGLGCEFAPEDKGLRGKAQLGACPRRLRPTAQPVRYSLFEQEGRRRVYSAGLACPARGRSRRRKLIAQQRLERGCAGADPRALVGAVNPAAVNQHDVHSRPRDRWLPQGSAEQQSRQRDW